MDGWRQVIDLGIALAAIGAIGALIAAAWFNRFDPVLSDLVVKNSRVWGLRGIWVSGGETEGLHFVGVLSFGDEFREDGALGGIQEKFGEALA
jgi:hypothetical protein